MTTLSKLPERAYGRLEAAVEQLGATYGQSAGSWVIDGNTTEDAARAILKQIDECEFDIRSPLSGEYADDPTPEELIRNSARAANVDVEITDDEDDVATIDELAGRFLDRYNLAFEDEVARSARAVLGSFDDEP